MNSYPKYRGFTIMDILISTAIVSLLSSVFLFQTTEAKKKAEDSQMKVEAHEVSSAVALYKNDNNGKVPLSVSSSPGVRYKESDPEYEENMRELVNAGYLPEIPRSPSGDSYSYLVSEDGDSAVFGVKLNTIKSGNLSKNSCSIQPSVVEYGSCRTVPKRSVAIVDGLIQWVDKTCSELSYDPQNEVCFLDVRPIFISNCNCSIGSQYADPGFPDQICSTLYVNTKNTMGPMNWNYLFGTRQDVTCPEVEPYASLQLDNLAYICELEGDAFTCNGSSDTDYCECI